ncbi:MAG: hypothetical protein CL608_14035 [Anaerolineaceae bacterium]|nr:hypothetical protein [Anaerolineaceae bacterium]
MGEAEQPKDQTTANGNGVPWEIVDFLEQGVALFTSDGRLTYVNAALAQMVGVSPEELMAQSSPGFTHPDDHEKITQAVQQALSGSRSTTDIRVHTAADGLLFARVTAVPHAETNSAYLIVTNLTSHKKAEVTLRQSEERYRRIVEDQTEFIVRWLPDGTRTFVNEAYCQHFSTPKEELVGSSFFPLIHEADLEEVRAKLAALTPENPVATDEHRSLLPDGSVRWHRWIDRAFFDEDGQITECQSVGRDITEQKKTELALKQSESNLNAILNNTAQSFILLDRQGRIQALNAQAREQAQQILGRNLEPGQDFMAGIQPIDPGNFPVSLAETFQGRTKTVEEQFVAPNGTTYWYETRYTPVLDEEGTVTGVVLGSLNVTQRKLAEQALAAEKAYSDALVDSLPGAFFLFTKEGRFLRWNKNMERLVGYSDEEIEALYPLDLVHEEDRATVAHKIEEIFTLGESEVEARLLTKDGRAIPYLFTSRRLQLPEGPAAIGLGIDISDRQEAVEKLRQSEANLRAIFNNTLQAFVLFDRERRVRAVNPVANNWAMEVLGHPLHKGEPADELFARFNFDNFSEVFQRALSGETIKQERNVGGGAQGFWFETNYNPVTTDEGIIGVSLSVLNITERKKAEEALRHSKAELQYIIDTVPEGVLLLTADGSVLMTNPVADQFLSILAPDLADGRITQLGERPLPQLFTSPPKGLWHEIPFKEYIFEAIARPIESSAQHTRWVLVLRDVTQERDIRQRVQRQERLAAVGQLAAGIAHDFNNIMAVIILYTQLLARTVQMAPNARDKLSTIESQAQRATDLIQQILDFSRQSVMEQQPLDLLPFMKEIVRLLERTLPENIRIELHFSEESYLIQGDPSRIQQVLMNLALNARDAMPNGGKLTISLANMMMTAKADLLVPDMPPGSWVQIQVTDDGAGIPSEALPHVFEPFFTTKQVGQGTGLGLAQVYGIVQQHEGYIDLETEVGAGTTFSLYFPALNASTGEEAASASIGLQQGEGQTVLLVEDDDATREALVDSLHLLNYTVLEAANGREALAILDNKANVISLVLSDVVMPEMGGIALFHAMQQQQINIPVILLTGHPLSKEFDNLKNAGLSAWLAKPPELVTLSHTLFQVLQHSTPGDNEHSLL